MEWVGWWVGLEPQVSGVLVVNRAKVVEWLQAWKQTRDACDLTFQNLQHTDLQARQLTTRVTCPTPLPQRSARASCSAHKRTAEGVAAPSGATCRT